MLLRGGDIGDKPLTHGPDHRYGGFDPIPGIPAWVSQVFEPADFFGNVTKELISPKPGLLMWPMEILFTATNDANPVYTLEAPTLTVQSSALTQTWQVWNLTVGGGQGGYFTSESFIGSSDTSAAWDGTIAGEGISVTATPLDLTTWSTGHVEVFILARIVRWQA